MSENATKILLVEDSPGDVELVRQLLQEVTRFNFELQSFDDLSDGLKRLSEEVFDILLLDLGLTESQGLETLSSVCNKFPHVPITVLTGLDDEGTAMEAVNRGAQDYLLKNEVTGPLLVRSILYAIERKRRDEIEKKLTQRIEAGLRAGNLAWWEMELPSGNVIFNDRKAEMLGYSAQMFKTYEDFTRLLHPDDYERDMQAMRDHLNGKAKNYDVEYRIKTSNGAYKWFRDVGGITEQNEATGYKRVIGIVENITERKRAERELNERIKELTCLYAVTRDMQEDLSVDEICQRAVEHLVPAMQFPEITVGVIELDGKRFVSGEYGQDLSHGLRAEIRVEGKVRGEVWVYYTEGESLLIPEEQNIINGVAQALGLWVEHEQARESLEQIEWLLTKSAKSKATDQEYVPPYGDLAELNTSGVILYS
ncbi:MAG: response regulator, partial [Dehalococcoidia bacterium]